MIDKVLRFLSKMPPEAYPLVEKLLDASTRLADRDPEAAMVKVQEAERIVNAEIAKRVVRRKRKP